MQMKGFSKVARALPATPLKAYSFLAVSLLAIAEPAHAERLTFDQRLYPPLKAVLDAGDPGMIAYNARDPRYVIDVIAIKGRSATDWSEAIEIIARTPSKDAATARAWYEQLSSSANRLCPATVSTLAEDGTSITYEQHSPDCPAVRRGNAAARSATTIARIVGSKRSLFAIIFRFKGVPESTVRQQALELLASAHIE
jgi:hypothetical protein